MLHISKYLAQHDKNELDFVPEYHNVEDPKLVQDKMKLMKEMYLYAVEDLTPNSPPPQGNTVEVNCFIVSDHVRDNITQISKTGILLHLNSAPILWYYKRQSTVKISTFCYEFVALILASELIMSLW